MMLGLEPTNACNLRCLHCLRDKLEDRRSIPLDVLRKILREASSYGISHVAITGGEPTLHPQLEDLLDTIARGGFTFHIITNGFRFASRVLPTILKPHIRRQLRHVGISLDGATAGTHDAIRGQGAFKAAMEMASLCKLKDIPFKMITVMNNSNKTELTDIALLGSGLGAIQHVFGPFHPTPLAVQKGIVPSPPETRALVHFVAHTLFRALKMPVALGIGSYCGSALLQCSSFRSRHVHVDYEGNAIFCCTLSHPADDGGSGESGREVLADLRRESLGTAIVRHGLLAAEMTEQRLRAAGEGLLGELDYYPCQWCFKQFGKLEWLKDYPDSPWLVHRQGDFVR